MALKMNPQGIMIYITMAIYAVALILTLAKQKKAGLNVFALGFVVALVSFGYRWQHVSHCPMQNLFEVFLTLGMLCYPISIFSRRFLKISGHAGDMAIGIILLFPAGFVFHSEPQHLPPALQSPLFVPHVAVYMISYVLMFKATICAFAQLFKCKSEPGTLEPEKATYVIACLGFPLLTLGLILGSVWGKFAWGDYWGWDPKELWSLASWLVFVGYFHVRYMFGQKYARLNSSLAILGMVFIVITLLWVNLSRLFPGLHSYAS
ncbi:MAG: cytochrome c biogenesis protein CcsA [Phycisphaerae bacterium]|nr:cytochrome c biogenesis protein CcsA [Phycisphaerae bacterium]